MKNVLLYHHQLVMKMRLGHKLNLIPSSELLDIIVLVVVNIDDGHCLHSY